MNEPKLYEIYTAGVSGSRSPQGEYNVLNAHYWEREDPFINFYVCGNSGKFSGPFGKNRECVFSVHQNFIRYIQLVPQGKEA